MFMDFISFLRQFHGDITRHLQVFLVLIKALIIDSQLKGYIQTSRICANI